MLCALCGLAFVCGVAHGQTPEAPTNDDRVRAIYDQLAASLARLESIEYTATKTITSHLPVPADSPLQPVMRYELHYAHQKDRFYSRTDSVDPDPERQWSAEAAFDGQHYQEFSGGLLRIWSDRPQNFASTVHRQPIVTPLDFAFDFGTDPVDSRFSTLADKETWKRLIAQSTWLRTETVDNRPCDVVQVLATHQKFHADFTYRLFLDRELDYYPVQWELDVVPLPQSDGTIKRSTSRTEGTVETQAFNTSLGRVVVPVVIKLELFFDGQLGRTVKVRIDTETLHVNVPIDEARFTIPRDRAQRVIDESGAGKQ
jgi:hypothetical protein